MASPRHAEPALRPALGPDAWRALSQQLEGRPFLRSEGVAAPIEMPSVLAPWLVEHAAEVVATFDRFYDAIVNAEGALAAEPARQIGEPYERIATLEGARPALPLARLDCVLGEDGRLRVIELNPVGVCTVHLRALAYTAHRIGELPPTDELTRVGRQLEAFSTDKVESIRRVLDTTLARRVDRPTIGLLLEPGMHRGSRLFWRSELERAGIRVVIGPPNSVHVEGGSAFVGDARVDALWVDWFVYLGYQKERYLQTRFASKMPDFSTNAAKSEALLSLPGFAEALADRAFTIVSPMRAYRALSKALLSWIDRDETADALGLSLPDRTFLRAHVAETYDHHARAARFTPEDARRRRAELVLKPCRFGGSHGVTIGRDTAPEAWAKKLDDTWADPEWVLQAFVEPARDLDDRTLSFGLYAYGGRLGGVLVRSASQTIVGARDSGVIAGLVP